MHKSTSRIRYTLTISIFINALILISSNKCVSQIAEKDSLSPKLNHRRLNTTIIGGTVLYAGTMISLSKLWYSDFEKSKFHIFNDNKEWLQMDKFGHALAAYHFSNAAKSTLEWSGLDSKKARNYAAAYGLVFQSTIELLDGYSAEWGASPGDIVANTSGVGIMWLQDYLWKEQRITMKFSHQKSPFADLRPNTFGSNGYERIMKDYNGQTYWLSANIKSFIKKETKIPSWINIAAGYGATEMLGSEQNTGEFRNFHRKRQYYISLDADLWRIKSKSKIAKTILKALSIIKIPAPTLDLSDEKVKFYWFYF